MPPARYERVDWDDQPPVRVPSRLGAPVDDQDDDGEQLVDVDQGDEELRALIRAMNTKTLTEHHRPAPEAPRKPARSAGRTAREPAPVRAVPTPGRLVLPESPRSRRERRDAQHQVRQLSAAPNAAVRPPAAPGGVPPTAARGVAWLGFRLVPADRRPPGSCPVQVGPDDHPQCNGNATRGIAWPQVPKWAGPLALCGPCAHNIRQEAVASGAPVPTVY